MVLKFQILETASLRGFGCFNLGFTVGAEKLLPSAKVHKKNIMINFVENMKDVTIHYFKTYVNSFSYLKNLTSDTIMVIY